MVMIKFSLILAFFFLYIVRLIYKSYQKGKPLGYGGDDITTGIVMASVILGQFWVSSLETRLIMLSVWMILLLLVYKIFEIHNGKHHSGEQLYFFRIELRKGKIRAGIALGVLLTCLLFIWFLKIFD